MESYLMDEKDDFQSLVFRSFTAISFILLIAALIAWIR